MLSILLAFGLFGEAVMPFSFLFSPFEMGMSTLCLSSHHCILEARNMFVFIADEEFDARTS